MNFQISGMYFWKKIGLKSNGKCHPSSRAHFSLLFCWKSDLGLSWRHLRGILDRLGKFFGPSWAPKTLPRCVTWAARRPQDATKTYPRAAQKISEDALGNPRPPRTSKTSKMSPKSRWGTPRGLFFLQPTWIHLGSFWWGFWKTFCTSFWIDVALFLVFEILMIPQALAS